MQMEEYSIERGRVSLKLGLEMQTEKSGALGRVWTQWPREESVHLSGIKLRSTSGITQTSILN
jgi:hypothetical protein